MTDQAFLDRLSGVETAAAADVMVAMGLEAQVLSPAFRAFGKARMAGVAVCARGEEGGGPPGFPTFDLDVRVFPGAVVVIAGGPENGGALIGENMVTSMRLRGAQGFLVDGGVRDSEALSGGPAPVWARHASPINAHRYWRYVAMGEPVTLPGVWADVTVRPGDYVLADADGVVILPAEHASEIVEAADIHMQTEAGIKAALDAGGDRKAATEASGRLKHVRRLTDQARRPDE